MGEFDPFLSKLMPKNTFFHYGIEKWNARPRLFCSRIETLRVEFRNLSRDEQEPSLTTSLQYSEWNKWKIPYVLLFLFLKASLSKPICMNLHHSKIQPQFYSMMKFDQKIISIKVFTTLALNWNNEKCSLFWYWTKLSLNLKYLPIKSCN